MTRKEQRRFQELLDLHYEHLRKLCVKYGDYARAQPIADRLLRRLFHRLDREFPDTKTPEGAREVLHILAIREEIAKADRAFERAQKVGE